MDCKEVLELIATDHIDGELSPTLAAEVKGHIRGCASCAGLELTLLNEIRKPLKAGGETAPPPELFSRIKAEIEADAQAGDKASAPKERDGGLMAGLFGLLSSARPVLTAATVVAATILVILYTGVPDKNMKRLPVSAYLSEDVEFLASLGEPENGWVEQIDFGTSIEEYFL